MTRKLILIFISIIFTIINLYSYENEYKIIRDANIYSVSDIENKKIGIIKKGAICKLVNFSTKREYDNEDKIFKILIKIKSEEIEGWIFSDNLRNKESTELNEDMIGNWTLPYYQEAISKNDEKIILKNEFDKEEMYTEKAFWVFFNPRIFIITNSTISFSASMAEPVCFINKIIKINDDEFKIKGIDGFTKEEVNLTIKLVNKRLKILNWNNYNWNDLIKIKSNELYNKLKLLRDNALSKFLKYFTPSISNLHFCETPDLNGKFIRYLNQGEKLKLIEKNKTETIDGVKGYWVKVKTEKDEVGWCFDAYLKVWNEDVKK